jgi:hypothetical protein
MAGDLGIYKLLSCLNNLSTFMFEALQASQKARPTAPATKNAVATKPPTRPAATALAPLSLSTAAPATLVPVTFAAVPVAKLVRLTEAVLVAISECEAISPEWVVVALSAKNSSAKAPTREPVTAASLADDTTSLPEALTLASDEVVASAGGLEMVSD